MSLQPAVSRVLLLAVVFAMLSAAGGCRWIRGESPYELRPESRPLEVPPDLDSPRADPAMAVPTVSAGTSASAAVNAGQAIDSFVVQGDTPDSVWRRLGVALARVEGVEITERAQLLNAYNVSYEGQSFLVRAQVEGESTRVSAVGGDGVALSGGAAGRLLAILRLRLA